MQSSNTYNIELPVQEDVRLKRGNLKVPVQRYSWNREAYRRPFDQQVSARLDVATKTLHKNQGISCSWQLYVHWCCGDRSLVYICDYHAAAAPTLGLQLA